MILAVFQRADPTAITEGMGITFSLYHESCWLAPPADQIRFLHRLSPSHLKHNLAACIKGIAAAEIVSSGPVYRC